MFDFKISTMATISMKANPNDQRGNYYLILIDLVFILFDNCQWKLCRLGIEIEILQFGELQRVY